MLSDPGLVNQLSETTNKSKESRCVVGNEQW